MTLPFTVNSTFEAVATHTVRIGDPLVPSAVHAHVPSIAAAGDDFSEGVVACGKEMKQIHHAVHKDTHKGNMHVSVRVLVTRTVQSILRCTPWACSQPFQLTLEDSTELCVLVLVRI